MIKKILVLSVIMILAVSAASGCSPDRTEQITSSPEVSAGDKISIVTTLFPQYDFARQVAGDKAEVTMLLPAGVESHSYEPKPEDIIRINSSDLLIYTGQYMEPWAQRIIDGISNKDVVVLDVTKSIELSKVEEHEHEEDADHEEHEHEEDADHEEHDHEHLFDPHVWTDPNNAKIMVDNIAASLCLLDPANAEYYVKNAVEYKGKLDALDKEFREIVSSGSRNEIIFGGRFAFHYFVKQYGLEYEAAYDSCSTETEPSIKVVAELIDEIKAEKFPVIYYEELSTPKVAQSISDETGAKMLLLHSCHNVSKDEFENGVTYLLLMKQNAENLREGLK